MEIFKKPTLYIYTFIILAVFTILGVLLRPVFKKVECMFMFHPDTLDKGYDFNLPALNLIYKNSIGDNITLEEKNIRVKSGGKINLIHLENPNSTYTILHSHGNAGNIDNGLQYKLDKLGSIASIVVYDYRGFGKSKGTTTEESVYEDIWTVWEYLVKDKGVKPENIILYGVSLGTSVAAYLANKLCKDPETRPRGLVMQSGFCNIKKISNELYPRWFTMFGTNKFSTDKYVKKIGDKVPILIAHSHDDELIGMHHKENLIKANRYIDFHEVKGGHNTTVIDKAYMGKIVETMC